MCAFWYFEILFQKISFKKGKMNKPKTKKIVPHVSHIRIEKSMKQDRENALYVFCLNWTFL